MRYKRSGKLNDYGIMYLCSPRGMEKSVEKLRKLSKELSYTRMSDFLASSLLDGDVIVTSAQFCQIWGVCSQSQRKDSTYSPGEMSAGICTRSMRLKANLACMNSNSS